MRSFSFCFAKPGKAESRRPRGAQKHPPQTVNTRGKAAPWALRSRSPSSKRFQVEGNKQKRFLRNEPPPESRVGGRFLIYSWLPINERVDFNTPAMLASPRHDDASCPAATSQRGGCSVPPGPDPDSSAGKGSGTRRPSRGTQQGWGHAGGRAEPSHPLPARWQPGEDVCPPVRPSAARGPSFHPLAPLHNQPTRQMSQQ